MCPSPEGGGSQGDADRASAGFWPPRLHAVGSL